MDLPHSGAFGVAQVGAGVHAQATSAAAETVALGTKLAAVALLAVHAALVLGDRGRLEHLLAQAACEAHLVPLLAGTEDLLSGVHGLLALGAANNLRWLEWHDFG